MVVEFPIAATVSRALAEPIGTASRVGDARRIAADYLLDTMAASIPEHDRDRFHAGVGCVAEVAFAPGRWSSREAVTTKWKVPIDAHWAEALAITDDGRTVTGWRLSVRYMRYTIPTPSSLSRAEREAIDARLISPPRPRRRPDRTQSGLDFGLFLHFAGVSPDALDPGTYEMPDPLRPGRTLPDE